MRVLLSWLREHVAIPPGASGRDVADQLLRVGHEVEGVHPLGDVSGEVVVGEVLDFHAETHKNGKTVRWCQVRTSADHEPRGVVCGASNFAVGDKVAVALPGAVLPGGFTIAARKTYGHVSDGMICSARELGVGAESDGILVLDPAAAVGADALAFLGLRDEILDIAVTPDRGYCLSVRGLARELATAYEVDFHDPAFLKCDSSDHVGWPVRVDDPHACDRFVTRVVEGLDPSAQSPAWLTTRLAAAGMRAVSLPVDITNYVMLELGQPLHGYDRDRLQGTIVVRRAAAGEKLQTLDGSARLLDSDDLLICDDSGPIGIAGVMGGASTELAATSTAVVIEAAHFAPAVVGRGSRRHRLPSEASRRFERGVDPALAPAAAQRAVDLLVALGGARTVDGVTDIDTVTPPPTVALPVDLPARLGGVPYSAATVRRRLEQVGCDVRGDGNAYAVIAPSWRSDLRDPVDLVEEVVRLEGYDAIPSILPRPPAGTGLTPRQALLRSVGRALAAAGYVEAPGSPFMGEATLDALGLARDDDRRNAVRLANPLSDAEPLMRTTLLPGLLATLRRNTGRGATDLALFETGLVFRPGPDPLPRPPVLGVTTRPTAGQLAALDAALPRQPWRVAVVLAGDADRAGWWGPGRPASWADAVQAAHLVAATHSATISVTAGPHAPWHPGRSAALWCDGLLVGHAGELHPRVVAALALPPRTCAMELELDLLPAPDLPAPTPRLSSFPAATSDVSVVVATEVPVTDVAGALRAGAGPMLESLRLFDVYVGEGVRAGHRSLAFRLTLRAPDRTLTTDEATAVRDDAVAEAARRTGAVLRG